MIRSNCLIIALSLVSLLVLWASPSSALTLPQVFSSNMVLQRAPQQARVWGVAAPGSVVSVQLDSLPVLKTFADDQGAWSLALPAQPASLDHTLSISADGSSAKYANVAFGDVWICSGQSNMEFAVSDSFNASAEIADSISYPGLRLFGIQKKASNTQLNDTMNRWTDGQQWVVSQPKYVGGPSFDYMSAACYFFGRELYRKTNGGGRPQLPIGLIDTCWGGTRVEAWTTQEGLDTCGPVQSTQAFYRQHQQPHLSMAAVHRPYRPALSFSSPSRLSADPDPNDPKVLYNGMIAPIKQLAVTGAIWYQGEANAGNATNYACRFPAMINDWRAQLNNFHLSFYFVLLAAYKEGGFPTWPLIRDAQLAALSLPYTGVGSAQDLGDEASPAGAIHPRNKSIVGQRLARAALHDVYGQTDVVHLGPQAATILWPLSSQGVQTVILRFQSSLPQNAGLRLLDTAECDLCCRSVNGSAITVQATDGSRHRASVTVDAASYTVLASVQLPAGQQVQAVQHNWEEYPQCALYNDQAIPMLPFNRIKP